MGCRLFVSFIIALLQKTGLRPQRIVNSSYPANLVLVDDLVSYHAVGARSVEDQEHRFVASGIDAPVGMKNPTSGNLSVMFNAIYAAQKQTNLSLSRPRS